MVTIIAGPKNGRPQRLVIRMIIERDLTTGRMAMSQGVGYTASIAAQMIVQGEIKGAGLLSPVDSIPYKPFMAELARRGIRVEEEKTWLD
ncbi:MAG: hypothetical protein HQK55_18190 [Deltaproteobacteria bacterium]|nr:hypothetical protein [Deltaproteobacteria bacterium]